MSAAQVTEPPVTPDGRYFVIRGRLWRCTNPRLPEAERRALVDSLMRARRMVGHALKSGDEPALAAARAEVEKAKIGLGERGPVWWNDDAADMNKRMASNKIYAEWFAALRATA